MKKFAKSESHFRFGDKIHTNMKREKNNWFKIVVGFYATNTPNRLEKKKKRKKFKLVAYDEASLPINIQ